MKMTKLLTGVAVAALLTGAANAQIKADLIIDTGANSDGAIVGTMTGQLALASELDVSSIGIQSVELALIPDSDEEFAAFDGSAAEIVVTLSGATFPSAVTTNDEGDVGTCDMTLVSGGTAGASTVTFEVPDIGGCDDEGTGAGFATGLGDGEDVIGFSLPIQLTSNTANVSVAVSAKANGAAIVNAAYDDGTLVSGTTTLKTLVANAKGFSVAVGTSALTTSLATAPAVSYNGLASATAGSLTFTDNTNVHVDFGTTDADWSSAAQIDEAVVEVSIADPSGFASVTLNGTGTNDTTVALVNGKATFNLDDTASTGLDTTELESGVSVVLNADSDNATLINETTFSIAVSGIDSPLKLTVGGASKGNKITRAGSGAKNFDWVGGAGAATGSVFRLVGFKDNSPKVRFTLSNSSAGADFNDTYELGAYEVSEGGELIVTNEQLAAIAGDFGRATVSFFVEATGVSVQLFQVTSGVITRGQQ